MLIFIPIKKKLTFVKNKLSLIIINYILKIYIKRLYLNINQLYELLLQNFLKKKVITLLHTISHELT